jgi:hypothetical protein
MTGARLTIDELRDIQRARDLLDAHVVSIDADGFTIAHTDAERKAGALEDCSLHQWLLREGLPECGPGLYTVAIHQPDAVSESYRSDPYDFEPLKAKVLELTGVVNMSGGSWSSTDVEIGGRCLITEIENFFGSDPAVVVTLAHGGDQSLYEGKSYMSTGWGGTDVTPGDPPDFTLGDINILEKLEELDGQVVHVRIEEP